MNLDSGPILITGFMPFKGETLNPSALIIEKLKQDPEIKLNLETLILPVVFKDSVKILLKEVDRLRPALILMLGQAGGRSQICLERVGLNWIETEEPDESGWAPPLGPIVNRGSSAFFSELPLDEWKKSLLQKDLMVNVSLSAGGYVCNHLYYHVLDYLTRQKQALAATFIHLPYVLEQAINKEPRPPAMDFAIQYRTLKCILECAMGNR
jgi:pyroglutamyl-peptidase